MGQASQRRQDELDKVSDEFGRAVGKDRTRGRWRTSADYITERDAREAQRENLRRLMSEVLGNEKRSSSPPPASGARTGMALDDVTQWDLQGGSTDGGSGGQEEQKSSGHGASQQLSKFGVVDEAWLEAPPSPEPNCLAASRAERAASFLHRNPGTRRRLPWQGPPEYAQSIESSSDEEAGSKGKRTLVRSSRKIASSNEAARIEKPPRKRSKRPLRVTISSTSEEGPDQRQQAPSLQRSQRASAGSTISSSSSSSSSSGFSSGALLLPECCHDPLLRAPILPGVLSSKPQIRKEWGRCELLLALLLLSLALQMSTQTILLSQLRRALRSTAKRRSHCEGTMIFASTMYDNLCNSNLNVVP